MNRFDERELNDRCEDEAREERAEQREARGLFPVPARSRRPEYGVIAQACIATIKSMVENLRSKTANSIEQSMCETQCQAVWFVAGTAVKTRRCHPRDEVAVYAVYQAACTAIRTGAAPVWP